MILVKYEFFSVEKKEKENGYSNYENFGSSLLYFSRRR